METADNSPRVATDTTLLPSISALGVEKRQLFERVRSRLGLLPCDQPPAIQVIGRYRVSQMLGRGGMGVVYLAHDPQLERDVAIKLVGGGPVVNTTKLRARLLREAQLLAKLRHPNIVTLYDSGEHQGELFLAMEYLPGKSLREWQETEQSTTERLLHLYIEAGHGLAAAHASGIIHRDFKPDNVFISEDGHSRVGDFGLANVLNEVEATSPDGSHTSTTSSGTYTALTQTGEFLGTLGYMAPEQLRGQSLDARGDQFAFCVALWEATTNTKPFEGKTVEALLASMARGETVGGDDLPRWLHRLLQTGLSIDPSRRHASMATLVANLQAGLSRRDRWLRRSVGVLLAIIISGAMLVFSTWSSDLHCPQQARVEEIRSDASWQRLRATLDPATASDLEFVANRVVHEASEICRLHEPTREQRLQRGVAQLERLAEADLPQVPDRIRELRRTLTNDPAPQIISAEVFLHLTAAERLESDGRFADGIVEATAALQAAENAVDRTEAQLVLGRLHSLNGEYRQATIQFTRARDAADSAGYDDARLRANLMAAKTTIMRLDDLEVGEDFLLVAQAILERHQEPSFSPRRADFLELSATLDKLRGNYQEAASTLERVAARRILAGSHSELSSALVGLGTLEEYRIHYKRAEVLYRLSLMVSPTDIEATHNLARLLVNVGERSQEAQTLLTKVVESSPELCVTATTSLLQLALERDDPGTVIALAASLTELLRDPARGTRTHRREAWMFVVFAHASQGDVGAAFNEAIAQVRASQLDPPGATGLLDQVRFGLSVASLTVDSHPDVARQFTTRAIEVLASLPDSQERRSLESIGTQLLIDIQSP